MMVLRRDYVAMSCGAGTRPKTKTRRGTRSSSLKFSLRRAPLNALHELCAVSLSCLSCGLLLGVLCILAAIVACSTAIFIYVQGVKRTNENELNLRPPKMWAPRRIAEARLPCRRFKMTAVASDSDRGCRGVSAAARMSRLMAAVAAIVEMNS